jgi:hypothetical protein
MYQSVWLFSTVKVVDSFSSSCTVYFELKWLLNLVITLFWTHSRWCTWKMAKGSYSNNNHNLVFSWIAGAEIDLQWHGPIFSWRYYCDVCNNSKSWFRFFLYNHIVFAPSKVFWLSYGSPVQWLGRFLFVTMCKTVLGQILYAFSLVIQIAGVSYLHLILRLMHGLHLLASFMPLWHGAFTL